MRQNKNTLPNPTPERSSAANTKNPGALRRTASALALTALAPMGITSVATAAEMIASHDPNPVAAASRLAEGAAIQLGIEACPPVPEDATMIQIQQEVNAPTPDSYEAFDAVVATAEAAGLEFAPPAQFPEAVYDAESPQAATEATSAYMEQQYGFSLTLDLSPEKQAGIDQSRYNQALMGMVSYTSLLPSQLLRAGKLPQVKITDLYDQTKRQTNGGVTGHAGEYSPETHVVTLDINYVEKPGVFMHEVMGHALQNTACDGAQVKDDEALSSQNPADFAYATNEDEAANSQPAAEVTATGYGRSNVREDDAELARTFITGDSADYLQASTGTPADRKLEIILSRYNDIAPGASTYLAAARPWFHYMDTQTNDPPVYTAPQ